MINHIEHNPDILRMAERQLRNWDLARSQRISSARAAGSIVAEFVTVSREAGAGGGQVARLLGERMGWPVLDKEILRAMSEDDDLRERIYASMDERDLSWCEENLRSLMHSEFRRNDYFHRLSEAVMSLARQGSAVFVGRGIDLMLPRGVGLRIRIVAPLESRVRRMMDRLGITEDNARTEIQRLEAERTRFIRKHFHIDVDDPHRYDLVVNLERYTPRQAVYLIESARRNLRPETSTR